MHEHACTRAHVFVFVEVFVFMCVCTFASRMFTHLGRTKYQSAMNLRSRNLSVLLLKSDAQSGKSAGGLGFWPRSHEPRGLIENTAKTLNSQNYHQRSRPLYVEVRAGMRRKSV